METNKKNKGKNVLIVILLVIILGYVGYNEFNILNKEPTKYTFEGIGEITGSILYQPDSIITGYDLNVSVENISIPIKYYIKPGKHIKIQIEFIELLPDTFPEIFSYARIYNRTIPMNDYYSLRKYKLIHPMDSVIYINVLNDSIIGYKKNKMMPRDFGFTGDTIVMKNILNNFKEFR